LLSSLASLGTYIQNHPTTKASNYFNSYIEGIAHNLNIAESLISKNDYSKTLDSFNREEAQNYFEQRFESININIKEKESNNDSSDMSNTHQLQEVQLVTAQLKWLYSLSEKIIKRISLIPFPKD
jgi:hypothetical protein